MYTTEMLRSLANSLGAKISVKYTDLINQGKVKEETRTSDEIIEEIRTKMGKLKGVEEE